MKLEHEELLAHILGESTASETEQRERAIREDAEVAKEAADIRAHLDLYEDVPPVAPSADCLRSIHQQIRERPEKAAVEKPSCRSVADRGPVDIANLGSASGANYARKPRGRPKWRLCRSWRH